MRKYSLWAIAALLIGGLMAAQPNLAVAEEDDDEKEKTVQGSIRVPGESASLAALAKVDLTDAVQAAVKHTPGKAIAAELEDEDGFLVYVVDVVSGNKVTEVTVDAGNKKILKSEVQDEDKEECDEEKECENDKGGKGGEKDED